LIHRHRRLSLATDEATPRYIYDGWIYLTITNGVGESIESLRSCLASAAVESLGSLKPPQQTEMEALEALFAIRLPWR
jgi:hypothetical protein